MADDGQFLHLEHPVTGDKLYSGGKPIQIKIMGTDSPKFREAAAKIEAKRAQHRARNRGVIPAAIDDALNLDLVTQMTVGWENMNNPDGTPLPFNPENVKKLYRERRWIFEQVNVFAADRANFLLSKSGN